MELPSLHFPAIPISSVDFGNLLFFVIKVAGIFILTIIIWEVISTWIHRREFERFVKLYPGFLNPKPKIIKEIEYVTLNPVVKGEIKPQENVIITLDRDQGIFRKDELNEHEIAFLKNNDYVELSAVGLESKKQDDYFILPRKNESSIHFFLCRTISDFIKQFTDKVWLYQTKKPDLIFQAGAEKFAVEVETGKALTRSPKQLDEKVLQLNREFGERWFFVVTDRKLRERYAKLGRTLLRGEVAGEIRELFKKEETTTTSHEGERGGEIQPKTAIKPSE